MADPHILSTLRSKRDQMEGAIRAYEKKIETLRRDLAHVNATLRLFELNGEHEVFPVHMDLTRLFKRGEIHKICQMALAEAPEGLDTRELSLAVIQAKGMDESDAVLRIAINYRIVQAMRMQEKRGRVIGVGKRKGVRVWRNGQS
ncbi:MULTISPECIES: hypothetical protein [Methylosinus]|uniref:Uncharacterized protein n=1 Tax=Methylosinus trichosporium (strain ATCC 35070 / NCIMB 11131 / UNIQEM 75 / OB3b) TaxID=595536 RepID=A0A2D2D2S9_METT3|nr:MULTISPECIES: hypothetical protein [Methylosinus]ATQ69297.1 hypothetical protein CQW49_16480 [Methylosinus trichosporium OB3b]OBS50436.1 hypothetical protein A8B73_21610 [Methylosinus sp. 3S-1]